MTSRSCRSRTGNRGGRWSGDRVSDAQVWSSVRCRSNLSMECLSGSMTGSEGVFPVARFRVEDARKSLQQAAGPLQFDRHAAAQLSPTLVSNWKSTNQGKIGQRGGPPSRSFPHPPSSSRREPAQLEATSSDKPGNHIKIQIPTHVCGPNFPFLQDG